MTISIQWYLNDQMWPSQCWKHWNRSNDPKLKGFRSNVEWSTDVVTHYSPQYCDREGKTHTISFGGGNLCVCRGGGLYNFWGWGMGVKAILRITYNSQQKEVIHCFTTNNRLQELTEKTRGKHRRGFSGWVLGGFFPCLNLPFQSQSSSCLGQSTEAELDWVVYREQMWQRSLKQMKNS